MGRLAIIVFMLGIVGCKDKAEPTYALCVKYEAENAPLAAEGACEGAIEADPNSTSGKAAAQKLKDLAPAVEKAKAEKAKADEAAQQAAAVTEAARVHQLRARVSKKFWGTDPDGDCTGKGLPPFKWSYEGGTYTEDREVAFADGCQSTSQLLDVTEYCCPQTPHRFGL
jgi:hypothetical protein